MGGAGWADPLPAMRAALRDCGIRLTHKRVAGDGNCFLHALACAAGTTACEHTYTVRHALAEGWAAVMDIAQKASEVRQKAN